MMEQCREPRLGSASRCRVHSFKSSQQGSPALGPALVRLARMAFGLVPSLLASRFLRRSHRYYERVRLPTSARSPTLALPCRSPPSQTSATDPVGPLMFQRMPSARDVAFDPGGATISRIARSLILSSHNGNMLDLRKHPPFEAQSHTPCSPCLHFKRGVTAAPARLGPDLPAEALVEWDLHPQAIVSFA
jgi:hypothetical protein